ncbi:MAG: hypothetical protein QM723_12345 [Myxococcaceae bacterium]
MGGIVRGIGNAIGGIAKGIGSVVSTVAKGVGSFLKSPLGQIALQVGLGFLTGGTSLFAGGGLSSLLGGVLGGGGGGIGGMLGGLLGGGSGGIGGMLSGLLGGGGGSGIGSLFSGLASNFLKDPASLLSGNGLSSILNFGQASGSNSGDLLSMVTGLFNAQKGAQDTGDGAQQGAQVNAQNMFAFLQAQQLMA